MSVFADAYGIRPWFFLVLLGLAVLLLVAAIVGGINVANEISCRNTAHNMDRAWRYNLTTGCLIHTDAGWIPLSNYRSVNQ